MTRFGSSSHVQQNGCLSHPQDLDAPLRIAAQRTIAAYQQQYADNQNISFLPAIVSTSTRMHGEFLRLLFLQTYRETEAHFTAAGMSSQTNRAAWASHAGGSSSPGHSAAAVQRGYWGPPIHNMGLWQGGEDPNYWKQFGPETTGH
jgi:hypothetical protein